MNFIHMYSYSYVQPVLRIYYVRLHVYVGFCSQNILIRIRMQALLKKHEALMSDLEAYHSVIDNLRETAQACKVST